MSTTTKNRNKPKIDFNQWTKDPVQPRTLIEIHKEVGFPFAAKVISEKAMETPYKCKTLPIGSTRRFEQFAGEHMGVPRMISTNDGRYVAANNPRWELLGHMT